VSAARWFAAAPSPSAAARDRRVELLLLAEALAATGQQGKPRSLLES
jgi:hypothetical protein